MMSMLEHIPGWDARRLREARLVLAGLGSLGAETARILAVAGVGRLVLADGERVAPEDAASAGMFRDVDAGMPRAALVRGRLAAQFPDLRIHAVPEGPLALGAGVIRQADLVVAADASPRTRIVLDRWCRQAGKPWLDAEQGVFHGTFRVFDAATGACHECGLSEGERKTLGAGFGAGPAHPALATPPTCSVLAGLVAQAAIKVLCPREGLPSPAGVETFYNGRTDVIGIRPLGRRADCVHPARAPVIAGPWSGETRLDELLHAARHALGEDASLELDRPIAWKLTCERCDESQAGFRSALLLGEADLACAVCGALRRADVLRRVAGQTPFLGMPVRDLGFPPLPLFYARSARGTVLLEPAGDRVAALGVTA